jgi:hypothetical protein
MTGVEGWSCNLTNSICCHDPSTNITGSITMWLRSFMIDPSNNCKGRGVTRQWQWGAVGEFCTCTVLIKFSDTLQSTSAETGVGERRGMETIVMNDNGEREEMVAHKCTNPSDEETSVM